MKDKTKIDKKYLVLVEGIIDNGGSIDFPLKKLTNGRVIYDVKEGKEAHTQYRLIKKYGNFIF